MKRFAVILLSLALLAGCQVSGVRDFWKDAPLLDDDISVSENRFADFAELVAKSPEADAIAALDLLFDRLKEDDVAYYVYSDWMEGAFYNLLSPCRSPALFTHAVDRMVADGIMNMDECRPFIQKREWISFNREGREATLPGVVPDGKRTLVLVLDLSCPSCREALDKLGEDSRWEGLRHIAICCGIGPEPSVPGWEYIHPDDASNVFDKRLTPIYFIVDSAGKVEQPYTPAL